MGSSSKGSKSFIEIALTVFMVLTHGVIRAKTNGHFARKDISLMWNHVRYRRNILKKRKLKRNRNLGANAIKADNNLENDVKASACHNA